MAVNVQEIETTPLQYDKEAYLAKFPEIDRQNVERITELFTKVMTEMGRTGLLMAVGGTITKPLPRKDIDLAVTFKQEPGEPTRNDYPDALSYSIAEFNILKGIVDAMLKLDPNFQRTNMIEPFMDQEFQNPNILAHDGNVEITNKNHKSMPVEFVRNYTSDRKEAMESVISKIDRPFVVLANVSSVAIQK